MSVITRPSFVSFDLAFLQICSNRITLYQILHDSHLYRLVRIISLPNFMYVLHDSFLHPLTWNLYTFVQFFISSFAPFLVEFVQICPNPIHLWSCEFFQDRGTRNIFSISTNSIKSKSNSIRSFPLPIDSTFVMTNFSSCKRDYYFLCKRVQWNTLLAIYVITHYNIN